MSIYICKIVRRPIVNAYLYLFICVYVFLNINVFEILHISKRLYFWMWVRVPICLCKAKNLKQHSVKPESSPRAKATWLISPTSLLYLYPSFKIFSQNLPAVFVSKLQNYFHKYSRWIWIQASESPLQLLCCTCIQV